MNWRLGPTLPDYVPEAHLVNGVPVPFRIAAAAGGQQVVVITPNHVWRASLADLFSHGWPEAPEAEMPSVGDRYEYTLLTHCGPFSRTLNLNMRSWIPDLPPDAHFPLSFDGFYEQGTLSLVADDRLEFSGGKGDVVAYVPSADPPFSFACH